MQNYRQLFDLTGKTAVVLGAASGIGQASAHALGSLGAHVICADWDADGARATADDITRSGAGSAQWRATDAASGPD
ncbi:MAG TPA: SDR family NAD(P)-dependent oxidoreductase, partial [Burkholderiaceae bacterium]